MKRCKAPRRYAVQTHEANATYSPGLLTAPKWINNGNEKFDAER